MHNNLRIAANFNADISTRFKAPGLKEAFILDDSANLMHHVKIEYAIEEDQLFRRLNYTLTSMHNMKKVGQWQNEMAQQLLYRLATSLSGSVLSNGRLFEKGMIILDREQVWDDVLPSDKPKAARKTGPKKEDDKKEGTNE